MFKILLVSATWMMGQPAHAQYASPEIAKYHRCYTIFTKRRAPKDDSRLMRVKAGTLKSSDACKELLKLAQLVPSEGNPNRHTLSGGPNNYNSLAADILNTFHIFHRQWFKSHRWHEAFSEPMDNRLGSAYDLYDSGESAYFLDNALFNPSFRYDKIVTHPTSFQAVRVTNGTTEAAQSRTYSLSARMMYEVYGWDDFEHPTIYHPMKIERPWVYAGKNGTPMTWSPPLIPVGRLIGVETMPSLSSSKLPAFDSNALYQLPELEQVSITDFRISKGAGILGSVPFILLNWGQPISYAVDGGKYVPRRLSAAIFRDLLCRELPVLRAQDIHVGTHDSYKVDSASPLSFRKSKTCMQCHATMDNLGYAYRNLLPVTSIYEYTTEYASIHLAMAPISRPLESSRPNQDPKFATRPAMGRLYYRSYNGNLVDLELYNPQDNASSYNKIPALQLLGEALADQEDLYVCAAQRYFKFLTNIDVNIGDLEDAGSLNGKNQEYRDFVIKLGKEFKSEIDSAGNSGNQQVIDLISKIIDSEAFLLPGQGVE